MRLFAALVSRLPLPVSGALATVLAAIWWWLLPIRRSVALDNLDRAARFSEKNNPNHDPAMWAPGPVLRASVRGTLLSLFEALRHARRPLEKLTTEGWEELIERTGRGEGSLILTGHGSAWELVGFVAARRLKLPVTVIVRTPTSRGSAAVVEAMRRSAGLELLPPEGSFFAASKALREGRVVVFLLDQRHNSGLEVDLFGEPALTSKGLALLARRSGAPLFPAWQRREGLGAHHFTIYPALPMEESVEEQTRSYMRFYEERIMERPSEWLWMHNRWRRP